MWTKTRGDVGREGAKLDGPGRGRLERGAGARRQQNQHKQSVLCESRRPPGVRSMKRGVGRAEIGGSKARRSNSQ